MSFDIIVPGGRFKRNCGALEAKFRDGALRYSQILKYITGPRTKKCPLVIVACAMAPKSRSNQQAYFDLVQKSDNEKINIYIVRHIKKPRSQRRRPTTSRPFVPYEDSLVARELEVLVVGTPTNDPKRVLVVVEAYLNGLP